MTTSVLATLFACWSSRNHICFSNPLGTQAFCGASPLMQKLFNVSFLCWGNSIRKKVSGWIQTNKSKFCYVFIQCLNIYLFFLLFLSILACLISIYVKTWAEHVVLKRDFSFMLATCVLAVDFFVDKDLRHLLVPVDSSMRIHYSRSLKHCPNRTNLLLTH